MRRFSRIERILLGWCLGMLCAVGMALFAFNIINRTVYDPAGQVRLYLQALQAGDGASALGISGATVPEDTGAAMLSSDALKNSMAELHDISVRRVAESDDGQKATVEVTYTVAGQEQRTEFTLHRSGSHWGIFDRWQMDSFELPTVEVLAHSVDAATLNGTKVKLEDGARDFAVFYPGEYDLTYESALYSAQEQSLVVDGGEKNYQLDLGLKPSEAAQREINHQVKTFLDSCASQNTLYPVNCPFEYSFSGRVSGDVTWSIVEYPETVASLTDKGNWQVKNAQGTAKVSFTQLDLLTGVTSNKSQEVPFTVSTTVRASGEDLTVTVK